MGWSPVDLAVNSILYNELIVDQIIAFEISAILLFNYAGSNPL